MMETPTQCPWCFVECKVYKVAAKKTKFAMVYKKKNGPNPNPPNMWCLRKPLGIFEDLTIWRQNFEGINSTRTQLESQKKVVIIHSS